MRVLIVHSRYRSGPASGENRVVEDEAQLLTEAGHEVEVFDPSVGFPTGLELLRAAARVIWSRDAAMEVRRRADGFGPDVVHVHNLYPALSPSVLRTLRGQDPLVMTLHNYRIHCLPGVFLRDGRICEDCFGRSVAWPGVIHRCYQDSAAASMTLAASLAFHRKLGSFEDVDLFLAISKFVRDKHIEGGLEPERVVVKPHFVLPQSAREGPGDHFLFVGRLAPEKGVRTLLHAWQGLDAKLVIVGDGPEGGSLRSIAPGNVEFTSTVSPAQVGEFVRGARALLVPSIWYEGAGRVVLEAYAAGVPVLASSIGALPEVVHDGTNGLLLPPGKPEAWREAVPRFLDDSESERMGRAAYLTWEEQYSPKQGLANLEAAYRRVAGDGAAVRRGMGARAQDAGHTEGDRG